MSVSTATPKATSQRPIASDVGPPPPRTPDRGTRQSTASNLPFPPLPDAWRYTVSRSNKYYFWQRGVRVSTYKHPTTGKEYTVPASAASPSSTSLMPRTRSSPRLPTSALSPKFNTSDATIVKGLTRRLSGLTVQLPTSPAYKFRHGGAARSVHLSPRTWASSSPDTAVFTIDLTTPAPPTPASAPASRRAAIEQLNYEYQMQLLTQAEYAARWRDIFGTMHQDEAAAGWYFPTTTPAPAAPAPAAQMPPESASFTSYSTLGMMASASQLAGMAAEYATPLPLQSQPQAELEIPLVAWDTPAWDSVMAPPVPEPPAPTPISFFTASSPVHFYGPSEPPVPYEDPLTTRNPPSLPLLPAPPKLAMWGSDAPHYLPHQPDPAPHLALGVSLPDPAPRINMNPPAPPQWAPAKECPGVPELPPPQPPAPMTSTAPPLRSGLMISPPQGESVIKHSFDFRSKIWRRDRILIRLDKYPMQEGTLRSVFYMKDFSKPYGPAQDYVAKISKDPKEQAEHYFQDCEMQALAGYLAELFLQMQIPKKCAYLEASVIECPERVASHGRRVIFAAEPLIRGQFVKYTNNYGWVNHAMPRATPQAFSHFSHYVSGGTLVVVDVQGVTDETGVDFYTDPQIHTRSDQPSFGKADLRDQGIRKFFETHECNSICHALGLPRLGSNAPVQPCSILPTPNTSLLMDLRHRK